MLRMTFIANDALIHCAEKNLLNKFSMKNSSAAFTFALFSFFLCFRFCCFILYTWIPVQMNRRKMEAEKTEGDSYVFCVCLSFYFNSTCHHHTNVHAIVFHTPNCLCPLFSSLQRMLFAPLLPHIRLQPHGQWTSIAFDNDNFPLNNIEFLNLWVLIDTVIAASTSTSTKE